MKIAILAFDRFTDVDVFLPWDLLNRVKTYVSDWEVKIIGTQAHHTSDAGLTIPMMGDLSELTSADAVLIASGPGVQRLIKDRDYIASLQEQLNPDRQLIGSMCSGAILLAETGLLQDVPAATTYATRLKQLAAYGVNVVEEPFVQHGNLATAAGCLAVLDLVRWFVTTLSSAEVAEKVLREVQPNGR